MDWAAVGVPKVQYSVRQGVGQLGNLRRRWNARLLDPCRYDDRQRQIAQFYVEDPVVIASL